MNNPNRVRASRRSCNTSAPSACVEPLEPRTLLSAGALDPTFGHGGITTFNSQRPTDIRTVAAADLPNGKTLLLGEVIVDSNGSTFALTRFNAEGSPDPTFGVGGTFIEPSGNRRLRKGELPRQIAPTAMAVDAQGRIYIVGSGNYPELARLNADGSADTTFGVGGMTGDLGLQTAGAIAVAPDGGVIIGGSLVGAKHTFLALTRVTSSGAFDSSFGDEGFRAILVRKGGRSFASSVHTLALDNQGRILVGGGGGGYMDLLRLDPHGNLDPSFNAGGGVRIGISYRLAHPFYSGNQGPYFSTLAVRDSDGAIFAGGGAGLDSGADGPIVVAEFSTNGVLNRHFARRGIMTASFDTATKFQSEANGIDLLDDGGLIVSGTLGTFGTVVAKLNASGAPDTSFGAALAKPPSGAASLPGWRYIQSTGSSSSGGYAEPRINVGILPGPTGAFLLPLRGGIYKSPYPQLTALRLNGDGSLDRAFGRNGVAIDVVPTANIDTIAALAVTPANGSIYVDRRHDLSTEVTALTADGAPVAASPSNVVPTTSIPAAVQPDGKLLLEAGTPTGAGVELHRYNTDGSLDTTFGTGGVVTFTPNVDFAFNIHKLLLRPDGSMVVDISNPFELASGYSIDILYILTADGTVTAQRALPQNHFFGSTTAADDVTLAPDGHVVVSAAFVDQSFPLKPALLRYNGSDLSPDASFGTNGRLDLPANISNRSIVSVLPDGRFILSSTAGASDNQAVIYSLTAAGALDTTFGPSGDGAVTLPITVPTNASLIPGPLLIQADGKMLATVTVNTNTYIVRLTSSGTVDPTFGTAGVVSLNFFGPHHRLSKAGPFALQQTPAGEKLLVTGELQQTGSNSAIQSTPSYIARLDL